MTTAGVHCASFYSSGIPAIKKTLWLLPKSFLPLPLAGLEPARCYPLDFESSASANSATAARSHEPKIILPYIFKSRKCFCLFLSKKDCWLLNINPTQMRTCHVRFSLLSPPRIPLSPLLYGSQRWSPYLY